MTEDIVLPYEQLILDGCCIINLCASGKMEAIVESLPASVFIAEYVREKELLSIANEEELQLLLSSGLILTASPNSEIEENTFVNLAVHMDDGEAMSAAIALSRGWAIGTDDKGAISIFKRQRLDIRVISTLDMIKHWAVAASVSFNAVQTALNGVRTLGKYEPGPGHHLYKWWEGYFEGK